MTRLIFARHGNTFDPGELVLWVGRGTDLSLVSKGRDQAHDAAAWLRAEGMVPDRVWCASLKRTRVFAEIVCGDLDLDPPRIDPRLDEIDYGPWEGALTEEIKADPVRAKALDDWQKSDVWPDALGWKTTKDEVLGDLTAFLNDLQGDRDDRTVLVVSSNGILRFAPRILGIADDRSFKLDTGAMGCLQPFPGGWQVLFWNKTNGR